MTSGLLASGSEDASLRYPLDSQEHPRHSLLIHRLTRKWEPSAGSRIRNKIGVEKVGFEEGFFGGDCAGALGGWCWMECCLHCFMSGVSGLRWAHPGGIFVFSEVGRQTVWYPSLSRTHVVRASAQRLEKVCECLKGLSGAKTKVAFR